MLSNAARRLVLRAPRTHGQRGYAGDHGYAPIPKPDTSMDHVFGDNSYKLDFNFQPPAMWTTFSLTAATLAVFGFPAWMMVYEESKMTKLKAQLAEARAAKEAKGSS